MVSERELADLQERVIRLRDDRTRMLVEHQEAIAERDRRIAELEGAIRTFLYDGNIREGAITANGCTCKYALESVEALDAALAGKGVSRG